MESKRSKGSSAACLSDRETCDKPVEWKLRHLREARTFCGGLTTPSTDGVVVTSRLSSVADSEIPSVSITIRARALQALCCLARHSVSDPCDEIRHDLLSTKVVEGIMKEAVV